MIFEPVLSVPAMQGYAPLLSVHLLLLVLMLLLRQSVPAVHRAASACFSLPHQPAGQLHPPPDMHASGQLHAAQGRAVSHGIQFRFPVPQAALPAIRHCSVRQRVCFAALHVPLPLLPLQAYPCSVFYPLQVFPAECAVFCRFLSADRLPFPRRQLLFADWSIFRNLLHFSVGSDRVLSEEFPVPMRQSSIWLLIPLQKAYPENRHI